MPPAATSSASGGCTRVASKTPISGAEHPAMRFRDSAAEQGAHDAQSVARREFCSSRLRAR